MNVQMRSSRSLQCSSSGRQATRPCFSAQPPARHHARSVQASAVSPSSSDEASSSQPCSIGADRRGVLLALGSLGTSLALSSSYAPAAQAFSPPPPGYRALVDKLDGYSFFYPERWIAVTSSGNDCFLRNPVNIDENVFVDISSPSSSRFASVQDLGSPEETAKKILEQYLNKEFMSTRIGIRREGQVLGAQQREGEGGRLYYDVAIRMTSYASRNPYVATQVRVCAAGRGDRGPMA